MYPGANKFLCNLELEDGVGGGINIMSKTFYEKQNFISGINIMSKTFFYKKQKFISLIGNVNEIYD